MTDQEPTSKGTAKKMQIRHPLALLAALILIIGAGCAQPTLSVPSTPTAQAAAVSPNTSPTAVSAAAATAPSTPASFPLTITDDAGRSVTLKSLPKKIVSLAPGNTEILYALGLADQIVGVTEFDDYPPEVKSKPTIGGFATVDAERVVGSGADLVLATSLHTADAVPALEKLGLTVVVLDAQSIDQVLQEVTLVGHLTGKDKEAQALTTKMAAQIADVSAKAKGDSKSPRVFWSLGDGLWTVGPGSFLDDLIRKANGTNVAADTKTAYPELSMEAVLKADPEVIVLTGPDAQAFADKLLADPAWQQVSAIKAKRFLIIADANIAVRPGPRIAIGLEALAKGLHPEQFK
jgi:iron complex transport system substrate-binding protein